MQPKRRATVVVVAMALVVLAATGAMRDVQAAGVVDQSVADASNRANVAQHAGVRVDVASRLTDDAATKHFDVLNKLMASNAGIRAEVRDAATVQALRRSDTFGFEPSLVHASEAGGAVDAGDFAHSGVASREDAGLSGDALWRKANRFGLGVDAADDSHRDRSLDHIGGVSRRVIDRVSEQAVANALRMIKMDQPLTLEEQMPFHIYGRIKAQADADEADAAAAAEAPRRHPQHRPRRHASHPATDAYSEPLTSASTANVVHTDAHGNTVVAAPKAPEMAPSFRGPTQAVRSAPRPVPVPSPAGAAAAPLPPMPAGASVEMAELSTTLSGSPLSEPITDAHSAAAPQPAAAGYEPTRKRIRSRGRAQHKASNAAGALGPADAHHIGFLQIDERHAHRHAHRSQQSTAAAAAAAAAAAPATAAARAAATRAFNLPPPPPPPTPARPTLGAAADAQLTHDYPSYANFFESLSRSSGGAAGGDAFARQNEKRRARGGARMPVPMPPAPLRPSEAEAATHARAHSPRDAAAEQAAAEAAASAAAMPFPYPTFAEEDAEVQDAADEAADSEAEAEAEADDEAAGEGEGESVADAGAETAPAAAHRQALEEAAAAAAEATAAANAEADADRAAHVKRVAGDAARSAHALPSHYYSFVQYRDPTVVKAAAAAKAQSKAKAQAQGQPQAQEEDGEGDGDGEFYAFLETAHELHAKRQTAKAAAAAAASAAASDAKPTTPTPTPVPSPSDAEPTMPPALMETKAQAAASAGAGAGAGAAGGHRARHRHRHGARAKDGPGGIGVVYKPSPLKHPPPPPVPPPPPPPPPPNFEDDEGGGGEFLEKRARVHRMRKPTPPPRPATPAPTQSTSAATAGSTKPGGAAANAKAAPAAASAKASANTPAGPAGPAPTSFLDVTAEHPLFERGEAIPDALWRDPHPMSGLFHDRKAANDAPFPPPTAAYPPFAAPTPPAAAAPSADAQASPAAAASASVSASAPSAATTPSPRRRGKRTSAAGGAGALQP